MKGYLLIYSRELNSWVLGDENDAYLNFTHRELVGPLDGSSGKSACHGSLDDQNLIPRILVKMVRTETAQSCSLSSSACYSSCKPPYYTHIYDYDNNNNDNNN